MKHFILLFVILLQTIFCDAQKIRFTDTSNKWQSRYDWMTGTTPGQYGSDFELYSWIRDTLLNNYYYKILKCTSIGLVGSTGSQAFNKTFLIREDTVVQKVFMVSDAAGFWDTTEYLLYDYNLTIGDTIQIIYPFKTFVSVVNSLDSVLINGTWHRKWEMIPASLSLPLQNSAKPYIVVEGIGSLNNPWFPVYPYTFENAMLLYCFFSMDNNPSLNPPVFNGINFNNTTSCTLSLDEFGDINSKVSVSPNPLTLQTKILLPYKISSGSLSICDFTGRKIYSKEFFQKEELPIGDLIFTQGIYFLQLEDLVNGRIFTEKFVQQ